MTPFKGKTSVPKQQTKSKGRINKKGEKMKHFRLLRRKKAKYPVQDSRVLNKKIMYYNGTEQVQYIVN